MSDATWGDVIGINLTGVFVTCRAVGSVLLERGAGAIDRQQRQMPHDFRNQLPWPMGKVRCQAPPLESPALIDSVSDPLVR